MPYLRNCWYMAAWSDTLRTAPLARTLLGEPIVLYRCEDGTAVALTDRCPHRFAPLSAGEVRGDMIVCRYHGLAFGANGACAANPHGPIVKAMAVRSYVLHEAYHALWIWMGEPDRADPALIRNLSFLDAATATAFSKGYVCGRGHYQLYTDNILDLTHADFLHPTTLGGGGVTKSKAKVEDRGESIWIQWHAVGEKPSPVMATRLQGPVDTVDSWIEVEWSAPAIMTLASGAAKTGEPRESGGSSLNVHIMTPETATSTHYFYAATRNYAREDGEMNARIAAMRDQIFATEDEPMIALQQDRIGDVDFWDLKPVLMRTDEGAVRVRRKLDTLISVETAMENCQMTGTMATAVPAEHPGEPCRNYGIVPRRPDQCGAAAAVGHPATPRAAFADIGRYAGVVAVGTTACASLARRRPGDGRGSRAARAGVWKTLLFPDKERRPARSTREFSASCPARRRRSHRHTASALRLIMAGTGGYTSVNGERAEMHVGDFIITPSMTFHDHGNDGDAPVIWLDGLDVFVVNLMNAPFGEDYPEQRQPLTRATGDALARYGSGLLPHGYEAGANGLGHVRLAI